MTKIVRSISEWKTVRANVVDLGFVPTMGALHAGHISLVEMSKRENTATAVSIFVNPTQFNDPKDLEKYPRTFEDDFKMLSEAGVDFLFYPEYKDLYPDGYRYQIQEKQLSQDLCGANRPGHFDGVLTVVMKLFQIIEPTRAYFGEKDFQQLRLIQDMVQAFFLKVEVKAGPIIREKDGLAMSSRNRRLSPSDRNLAPKFFAALSSSLSDSEIQETLRKEGFRIDYIKTLNLKTGTSSKNRRFGAVKLGELENEVRLIDNVEI